MHTLMDDIRAFGRVPRLTAMGKAKRKREDTNEDEYVRIAVELSNDPERLQRIKSTLRKMCLGAHSPCCFQSKGILACSLVPCLPVQSQIYGLEMTASPA